MTTKKTTLNKSQLQKGEIESIVSATGEHFKVGEKLYWDKESREKGVHFAMVDEIECEMAVSGVYANVWIRDKKTKELTYIYSVYGVSFITYKTQPTRIEEDVVEEV